MVVVCPTISAQWPSRLRKGEQFGGSRQWPSGPMERGFRSFLIPHRCETPPEGSLAGSTCLSISASERKQKHNRGFCSTSSIIASRTTCKCLWLCCPAPPVEHEAKKRN